MIHPCGCINEIDEKSGVMHCVKKCDFHIDWSRTHPQGGSIEYYKEIGAIENGIPQNFRLIEELIEPLHQMRRRGLNFGDGKCILELGCGLGPYIPYLLGNGWLYFGMDSSEFACNWVKNVFGIDLNLSDFECYDSFRVNAILAAHLFEHLHDCPAGLKKAYDLLLSRGSIYLIVPDDGDPTNPDHWWFFTETTLLALLEKIGFTNISMTMRKRVPQENFIYCVAEKP